MVEEKETGDPATRLLEVVKVETYLKRVHCPNKQCKGTVEFDGKERAQEGLHGGPREYRHICGKCKMGIWMKDQFPKVEYKQIPV